MSNKNYRKAYDSAAKELETLLRKKKSIESRILSIRKTMNVLSTLLKEEGDEKWLENALGVLDAIEPSLTDDIYSILNHSPEPFTTTDVLDELKKFSRTIAEHKNPLATINAVLMRLVEQKKATLDLKDGRKAWRAVPTFDNRFREYYKLDPTPDEPERWQSRWKK